jgi:hypothetical protein
LKKSLLVYICPTVYQANKVCDSIEYTENMPSESMKAQNENAFATKCSSEQTVHEDGTGDGKEQM